MLTVDVREGCPPRKRYWLVNTTMSCDHPCPVNGALGLVMEVLVEILFLDSKPPGWYLSPISSLFRRPQHQSPLHPLESCSLKC